MNVVSGKTYYFTLMCLNKDVTFRATMGGDSDKLDTVEVSPAPGSVFNVRGSGQLEVTFNKAINAGKATVKAGANSAEVNGNVYEATVSYSLKNIIYGWMKQGAVKAGDKLTVTVADISSALNSTVLYGTDGKLVLEYLVPDMPVTLQSENVPAKFLSYWPEGTADGIVKLAFSGKLGEGTSATLSYGNPEREGEFYTEKVPVKVSGSTLTVDLTGKVRTPKSMLPSSSNPSQYTTISLKISNVTDSAGNACYSERTDSNGSFQYSFDYVNVAKDVTTEFTPKSGESIADKSTIELWIDGKSSVQFSGVNFAYNFGGVHKNVVVDNKDITEEKLNDDEYALTIPVPDEARKGTAVLVSLKDLVFAGGIALSLIHI